MGPLPRRYRHAKSNLASKTQTKNNQIATNKNVENEKKLKPIQEPKISHDESSTYFQLAQTLYNHIQENHPGTKQPNLQRWSKQLCQLVENDQRTIEQIQQVITWTQAHHFWHTVVLSPAPMKRNWDRIIAQIKQKPGKQLGKVQHLPINPVNGIVLDFTKGEPVE